MLSAGLLLAHLAAALLVSIAVGLLVRRRVTVCWSFFTYVIVTLAANRLQVHFPERFSVFTFYSAKETTLFVLKLLIAIEIWLRTFSAFPRARVRVGLLLAGALLVTATAVWGIPSDLDPYDALIATLFPRQQAGTLSLFAVVVSAAAWYRVPLHPFYRFILVGFAGYLTLNVCLTSFLGLQSGGEWIARLGRLDQIAYVATAVVWASAAWRPMRSPTPIATRLQPWARSW
jgi:hypothetical protein